MGALSMSEPMSDTVNLVFAADNAFLPYTAVTLASVLRNYRGTKPIKVFILLDQWMQQNDIDKFDTLNVLHPYSLEQIVIDADEFKSIRTSDGISVATYYRLRMHEMLPPDVHKVLYLDSDLIIRETIDELFDTLMDGCIFAGVEDSRSRDYIREFGIPKDGSHINAGVMLVNLDLMRNVDFTRLVSEYLEANRYRVTLGDQQIIGELFPHSIKYVPVKWNVHGPMFQPGWVREKVGNTNNMEPSEAEAAVNDPAIIHYTLKRKPWMSMEHPKSDLWFEYLDLTPYSALIKKPSAETDRGPPSAKKKGGVFRLFGTLLPGYLLSVWRLRDTRIQVIRIRKHIESMANADFAGIPSGTKPPRSPQPRKTDLDIKLKQVLAERALRAPDRWTPSDFIELLPPHSSILSNVSRKDIDGGYAENIKLVLRTTKVKYSAGSACDAVALLSQRIHQGMFWDCIETAYLYDKTLIFVEVAMFAGFASYFDMEADLYERRAMGFILDDLGYYFDSRQPSRLERTLNDPSFSLTEEEHRRARALIDRIVRNHITKYNKYVHGASADIEDGAIIIIDQKRGDASIEFGGAKDEDFEKMILAASFENPDRTVYLKRHPDSIHGHDKQFNLPILPNVSILPDDVTVHSIIDKSSKIYTISSQVGFEALLRGKEVVTFGQPFYSGWGLTDDRNPQRRRTARRSIEDLFHVACIGLSIYVNPYTGQTVEMEEMLDLIEGMRNRFLSPAR